MKRRGFIHSVASVSVLPIVGKSTEVEDGFSTSSILTSKFEEGTGWIHLFKKPERRSERFKYRNYEKYVQDVDMLINLEFEHNLYTILQDESWSLDGVTVTDRELRIRTMDGDELVIQ